jgi:hypothetical protein
MTYTRHWLRPSKLREYYVDPYVRGVRDAEYQLYWAVVEGNVRARLNGRLLTSKETHALRDKRWSDAEDDIYALPPDIELSVEDAKRIWVQPGQLREPTLTPPTAVQQGQPPEPALAPLTASVRKRGPRGVKLEGVKEAMRKDIQAQKYTCDQLRDMLEKDLKKNYGVSRDTARKARNAILSEFVANKTSTNDN